MDEKRIKELRERADGYPGSPWLNECLDEIERLQDEVKGLQADYARAVTKFDDCRGVLAECLEACGRDPENMPDDGAGAWHTWLGNQLKAEIERLRAAVELCQAWIRQTPIGLLPLGWGHVSGANEAALRGEKK